MRMRTLVESGPLPLVVEPDGDRSCERVTDWLTREHDLVESKLLEHGAILLRGFDLASPAGFERVARAIDPELKKDYLGTSPRDALTDYVFSASELPPYYPIPQHCEMTFLREPPRRLFFCCLVAPQGTGGETPLADFRKVLESLDPATRDRFEQRGLRIIRNYSGPGSSSGRFDLWKLKRWDEMFQTTDRTVVEQKCKAQDFESTWTPDGGLRLVSSHRAVRPHPVTGVPVWFNHSQVFHLSSAAAELGRAARRQGSLRLAALAAFARAAVFVKRRRTRTEDQALECTYGDGTPIEDRDMDRVRDAIWRHMVFFRWQAGDVLAIDNAAVAHGRMPYRGPRKVVVCWA
jgi:alpha-ketoglutarate-dependent taurine dioxygenase